MFHGLEKGPVPGLFVAEGADLKDMFPSRNGVTQNNKNIIRDLNKKAAGLMAQLSRGQSSISVKSS